MPLALFSFSFLTPLGALIALAAVVPLTAFAIATRRLRRVRAALRLSEPSPAGRRVVAAVAALALLGLAATQPAVTTGARVRVRRDSAVMFVIDTSRSMLAQSGRHGRSRIVRAIAAAKQLRAAIPDVQAGVATFTDRVVPNLLPVADQGSFDQTLDQAIGVEEPGPLEQQIIRSTTFDALTEIPTGDYFEPHTRSRVVVFLTDGETRPFNAAKVGRSFLSPQLTQLMAIQFWHANESVYKPSGQIESRYVPDSSSRTLLFELTLATHGRRFFENQLGAAAASLRASVEHGPLGQVERPVRTHPLAPWIAAAAFLPLVVVFGGIGLPTRRRVLERVTSAFGH